MTRKKIFGLPIILVIAAAGFFVFKKQIMAFVAKLKKPAPLPLDN